MKQYKKMIAITPRRLGDTMFCLPVFRLLKKAHPDAEIDIIARTAIAAEVLRNNLAVREIFISPDEEKIKKLKNEYELIINLDDEEKSDEMAAQFSGKIIGGARGAVEGVHRTEKIFYYFERQLEIDPEGVVLRYDLYPKEENFNYIKSIFKDEGAKYVGFHVGCHSLAKKSKNLFGFLSHPKVWPTKHFITLAKMLTKYDPAIKIVLTGSKDEIKIAEFFAKKIPNTLNFAGKTSVLDAAALISRLKLFVTNDTGMLHVACSTNVPLISLHGDQTDYRVTGPFPKNEKRIVFHQHRIDKIDPEKVFERAVMLFEQ